MEQKIQQLNAAIAAKVDELGLMFVNGPGTTEFPADLALAPDIGPTNLQERGMFGFAVAERA